MRTTLDIEPGLLKKLRREAERRQVAFKHLVNRLLRDGLSPPNVAPSEPYQLPTFDLGQPMPGVNLDKALRLADDLEDEEVLRKMQLRK